jgi:hypothetical protein
MQMHPVAVAKSPSHQQASVNWIVDGRRHRTVKSQHH